MLPAKNDRTLVQRRRILLAGWLLANGAVVIRAVDVQVLESAMWRQAAAAQHQKAQWRLDFVAAENSMGFHAPQEMARILGEVIDHARLGQLEAERATRKK